MPLHAIDKSGQPDADAGDVRKSAPRSLSIKRDERIDERRRSLRYACGSIGVAALHDGAVADDGGFDAGAAEVDADRGGESAHAGGIPRRVKAAAREVNSRGEAALSSPKRLELSRRMPRY